MQKTPLATILREEIIRGITFALSFGLILVSTITGVAYASGPGGVFGDILNMILASGNYLEPQGGTVKDSAKLGGEVASKYVKTDGAGYICPDNQCIYMIKPNGTPGCR